MSKKLAIKGHLTRGKEVIELFKMMGGCECGYCGGVMDCYYYISQFGNIEASCKPTDFDTYIVYTLEEFWKKYPFKVGDKVIDEADGCPGIVTEMKWDEDVSDMKYCVAFGNGIDFGWFANDSINYFKIKKSENLEENKFPSFEPMFKMNDELEYKIPDGYEITEVSKGKVFIKPIKSKYPITYDDCCNMLNADEFVEYELMANFPKLINARNAYWKIAGEQMGLGKTWEPDWKHLNRKFYCIYNSKNNIVKNVTYGENKILAFPTEEMRDAFYENFKDLIEQCKELL